MNEIYFYDPTIKTAQKRGYGEDYIWCSNFYDSPITINGELWPTAEHYFQSMKFRSPNASEKSIEYSNIIKIANTPSKVFTLGQQKKARWGGKLSRTDSRELNDIIEEYSDVRVDWNWWNGARIDVMIRALLAKFRQHPDLLQKLIDIPDDYLLVEHIKRDKFWADGLDGSGKNYLGRILTILSGLFKGKDIESIQLCKKVVSDTNNETNTAKELINNRKKQTVNNTTTVSNCKVSCIRPKYTDLKHWLSDPNNVYIGRAGVVFVNKERFPKQSSKFANIYKIGKDGDRNKVIQKYKTFIKEKLDKDPELVKDLLSMRGKNLGCWCAPEPCHGDVLVELMDEYSKK